MNNGRGRRDQLEAPSRATMTDLRLTRHPVDTPRGRLHRLATVSIRAVDEVRRASGLSKSDLDMLRSVAHRAYDAVLRSGDDSAGAHVVHHLCWGLDRAIEALALVAGIDVVSLCEGLTKTLVQLEVAENTIREQQTKLEEARQDTRYALADVTQLRTLLAAAHDQAARKEAAENVWNEPTRRQELSGREKQVIDDPDTK